MKLSYNWLKDFIDIELAPSELAEKLTSLGIEVSEITTKGACFSGVVTAEIIKIEKHPNADKLSLVEVNYGEDTTTVVCGAKNIEEGQIIPLALVGAKLVAGKLKKTKIRGIESEGMLCSADELGLEGAKDGILILPAETKKGLDFAKMQGEGDTVFELELTPNRGDLISHFGIARELAILLNISLKKPAIKTFRTSGKCIPIKISAKDGCKRYLGRVIKDIEIKQSPVWIKERLSAIGINPKNALVDITNYILHEFGQPLHSFDLDKLKGPEIDVRSAKKGEKFKGLDEIEYTLDENCLAIADAECVSGLGGIIGGLESAITEKSKNILLESAYFTPSVINVAARKLGLKTDASYIFERGADIDIVKFASDRAVQLILETCGGTATEELDIYPEPFKYKHIEFNPEFINKLLGTNISNENIAAVLSSIDKKLEITSDKWIFHTQSHRIDLNTKWDLAEEVGRFCGYESVSENASPVNLKYSKEDPSTKVTDNLRDILFGLGFYEAVNYDFVSEKDLTDYGCSPKKSIKLKNPLSVDLAYLRPSMLINLMKTFQHNEKYSGGALKFFEIGKIYFATKDKPAEKRYCSGILGGNIPSKLYWDKRKTRKVDFYDLKGYVLTLLDGFGVNIAPSKEPAAWFHPNICAEIMQKNTSVGVLGKLHPNIIKASGLKNKDVWFFNIDISKLNLKPVKKVKKFGSFPSSWRDLSVVVDKSLDYKSVFDTIIKINGSELTNIELTDIYEGEKLSGNKKSVTVRLTFSLPERTLKDSEIDVFFNNTVDGLKTKLNASLRE